MAKKSIKRKAYRSKRSKVGEHRRVIGILKWGALIWILGLLYFYWKHSK